MDIVPINASNNSGSGSGGGGGGSGNGSSGGQEATNNLSSQNFHFQQIVGDMWNKVNSLFSDQQQHINTLHINMKRIALIPDVHGVAAEPPTTANEQRRAVPHLSKFSRDLWVLWREWEQVLGGGS